jgi:hypothetical protein
MYMEHSMKETLKHIWAMEKYGGKYHALVVKETS